jgi:hypothetical protein
MCTYIFFMQYILLSCTSITRFILVVFFKNGQNSPWTRFWIWKKNIRCSCHNFIFICENKLDYLGSSSFASCCCNSNLTIIVVEKLASFAHCHWCHLVFFKNPTALIFDLFFDICNMKIILIFLFINNL